MLKFIAISISSVFVLGSWLVVERRSTEVVAPAASTLGSQGAPQTRQIFASGIVEGATEEIELQPDTSGRVTEVLVRLGDWVEANQPLLRLDDRSERAQVAASQANLRLAEANLDRLVNGARETELEEARAVVAAKQARLHQARLTWQRVKTLHAQQAIAQQEADDQEGLVLALTAETEAASARLRQLEAPPRVDSRRAAEARVAAAQADCELAKIALDRMTLCAPTRAQVIDVQIEPGELILPARSGPVLVLTNTSSLRVRAFVEEIDAPSIALLSTARITADGLPGQSFTAKVRSLSPRMMAKTLASDRPEELYDSKVREVMLEVDPSADATRLIVGLRVDVEITAQPTNEVLTNPFAEVADR